MVMVRNLVKVGNREVKKRYIGNKLIFEDLSDKTEILSGEKIYTDKVDDSVVHVDIDGKSYQDGVPTPEYPIEIHSLNDFDVVSSQAVNMFSSEDFIKNGIDNGLPETNTTLVEVDGHVGFRHRQIEWAEKYFNYLEGQFEENTSYTFSFEYDFTGNNELSQSGIVISYTTGTNNVTTFRGLSDSGKVSMTTDPKRTVREISIRGWRYGGSFKIWKISLTKTNDFKEFVPHTKDITENDNHPSIDKINLLLDEPLRSVGDVKDRLFRDSDGLWKIERNVGAEILDSSSSFTSYSPNYDTDLTTDRSFFPYKSNMRHSTKNTRTTHFIWYRGDGLWFSDRVAHQSNNVNQFHINFPNDLLGILPEDDLNTRNSKIRAWLEEEKSKGTPLKIQYELNTPTIETPDQEIQDKLNNLRSFQGSNYVYTISNTDISPTLHTTFKSKGWYDYYLKTLLK